MAVPLSKDEFAEFTPDCLKNLVPRPSFRFRPVTTRDSRRFSRALMMEGLTQWDQDVVRAETETAVKALWSEKAAEHNLAMLRDYWARVDQDIDIPEEDHRKVLEFMGQVQDCWPMLRRMGSDNALFMADAPRIALAMYLAGMSNLDVPFAMEGGMVPLETIDEIEAALKKVETKAVADKVEGVRVGAAFAELLTAALGNLRLTRSEEKNSPSPQSPPSTPNGSDPAVATNSGRQGGRSSRARTSKRSAAKS